MRVHLASLALAAVLLAGPALAGPGGGADPRVAARALAEHGYALYEQGKYQEALEVFQQADKLFHAPTLVFAQAKAQAGMGRLVEARALFQRVVAESLPASAPQAFRDAQQSARDEVAALDQRVPTLAIVVRGGGGRGLRVTVDEADVPSFGPDAPLPLNPGAHRVAVVPLGGVGVSQSVTLREGARERVIIELPVAAPIKAPADPGPSRPAPPRRPWLVPSLMGFGLGAVGLGLGIGAGVAALHGASSLRDRCGGDLCPNTTQNVDDLSAAKGLSTASTVGFVLAGVGVATGVVLLVVRPGAKAPARAGIAIGPGSIGVQGVF